MGVRRLSLRGDPMPLRTILSSLCVALGAACAVAGCSGSTSGNADGIALAPEGGAPSSDPEDSGTAAAEGGGGPTGASSNGELKILSLTPTSQTMTGGTPLPTETGAVTFIAIVTDAAGLDAIAGGQLMDDSGATFAAFGAGANKGTYTATITWEAMATIHAADFGVSGGKRTFVAKFFDNHANEAKAAVDINLACRAASKEAISSCGGVCASTVHDPKNCGACGTVCSSNTCVTSKCTLSFAEDPANPSIVQSACAPPSAFAPGTMCQSLCTTQAGGHPNCTRIVTYGAADLTCAAAGTDGSCTADLSQATGPVRCRCGS
jgi:hypothetical protein